MYLVFVYCENFGPDTNIVLLSNLVVGLLGATTRKLITTIPHCPTAD